MARKYIALYGIRADGLIVRPGSALPEGHPFLKGREDYFRVEGEPDPKPGPKPDPKPDPKSEPESEPAKEEAPEEAPEPKPAEMPKRRGRPPGSKNRPRG